MLLYEWLIPENRTEFIKKVEKISDNLNINPNWLMLVFYIETGASRAGVISHKAKNPLGSAVGLIQFLSSTAKGLGTTTQALLNMSNVQQLDYVEKYLKPYKGRMTNYADVYLAVLFPVAVGKPDSFVLEHLPSGNTAEKVGKNNPLHDVNKDGIITVGEVKQILISNVPKDWQETIKKKV